MYIYEEYRALVPTSRTWTNAQSYASMNDGPLAQYGVHAVVTGIRVDQATHTVFCAGLGEFGPVVPQLGAGCAGSGER